MAMGFKMSFNLKNRQKAAEEWIKKVDLFMLNTSLLKRVDKARTQRENERVWGLVKPDTFIKRIGAATPVRLCVVALWVLP